MHTLKAVVEGHLSSLVLAVTNKLLGVGRAQRAILLASDSEPSAGRREVESASERHLRPPLRQAHGQLGRPVPNKRGPAVPFPLVRFLAEIFYKLG